MSDLWQGIDKISYVGNKGSLKSGLGSVKYFV